jgi:hypothetical protein
VDGSLDAGFGNTGNARRWGAGDLDLGFGNTAPKDRPRTGGLDLGSGLGLERLHRMPGNAARAFTAVAARTAAGSSPRTRATSSMAATTFPGSLSRPRRD